MAFRNRFLPDLWRGEREWNPIREMNRLQRNIDRMFEDFLAPTREEMEFIPACDVEDAKDHYLISFDLPGVKKDDVKIELSENILTVSGERKEERKEEEKGRMSRERFYGTFSRSFTLPSAVDAQKIEAHYDNGVLRISIPKSEAPTGKQIPIREAKQLEGKKKEAAA